MSLSVHFNAYNQKGLTGGVQAHQERFSEKEALHALKNTKSNIDPSETKYNVSLYRDEVLETKTVKRVAKELTDQFQANREKAGLKRKRSDFKTMMVGTFQISDETLDRLGYDKAVKWSENSDRAKHNVTVVYEEMVKNALRKPDYYGRVMTATMHVDESTPHVDFMCIGVDPERLNFGVREILNGEETKDPNTGKRRYKPKGAKLAEVQDDLSTIYGHNPELAEKFELVRGSAKTKNIAEAKALRSEARVMLKRDIMLDDREDDLNARESKLNEKEKHLTEKELKLASKESELDSREIQLDEAKKRLDEREQAFKRRESTLNDKEIALSGLKSDYDALISTHNDLKSAYYREKGRRIELEATYEFDTNNPDHHYFKKRQLEERRKQKTPQTPKQQTKNNGYSL